MAEFAVYDSFTEKVFGGSQVCVVTGAAGLGAANRGRLAREIGHPATAFVDRVHGTSVEAQFFSTVMELPMCGHGTLGLITRLIETGALPPRTGEVTLCLPAGEAQVEISAGPAGRPFVMLDVRPPAFRDDRIDRARLAGILGLDADCFAPGLPLETATADFVHIVAPLRGLDEMTRLEPDFGEMVRFCHDYGFETVASFCLETLQPDRMLHVRDFCPAVGVPESSSAGTTNAALAAYLIRHGLAAPNEGDRVEVLAEQGIKIGRPSSIRSLATVTDGQIARLQVGGVATKIAEGVLHLETAPG